MFTVENIKSNMQAQNKNIVLDAIAKRAFELGIVENEELLLKALHEREQETCTGMINGVAIPHARSECIKKATILFIKLDERIEWESLDGEKCDLIFALLAPNVNGEAAHLKMLSNIATGLMDKTNVSKIRMAQGEYQIYETINSFLSL